jgi:hypothetical protein
MERAVELDPLAHRSYDNPAFTLLLALGRDQEALQLLDASWLTRPDISYLLSAPNFDPLREDPRFLKIREMAAINARRWPGLVEPGLRSEAYFRAAIPLFLSR